MASQPNIVLAAILLALVIAVLPPAAKSEDTCPYPCYPPPTGTGTPTTPATQSPPSQSGFYAPPAAYFPYNPPAYDGDNFNGVTPSPPDPILPYFPYYYKKPPRKPDDESGGTAVAGRKWEVGMVAGILAFICSISSFSLV